MSKLNQLVGVDTQDGDYVMEYQVESQRGFHVFGSMYFSSYMRLPLDPVHYTDVTGLPLGEQLTDFEVPDGSWVWAWSRWYVDMSSDVDDQGWCYSWHFKSKKWTGRHRFMRSFVRQRLWKRPRVKRHVVEHAKLQTCEKNEVMYTRTNDEENFPDDDKLVITNTYDDEMLSSLHPSSSMRSLRAPSIHIPSIGVHGLKLYENTEDVDDEKVLPTQTLTSIIAQKLHMTDGPFKVQFDNNEENTNYRKSQAPSIMSYTSVEKRQKEELVDALMDHLGHLRNDRERMDFIYNFIIAHPDHSDALVASRDNILAMLRFPISVKTLITKLSQSGSQAAEKFALMPSNSWTDQVLLHGEPTRDATPDHFP